MPLLSFVCILYALPDTKNIRCQSASVSCNGYLVTTHFLCLWAVKYFVKFIFWSIVDIYLEIPTSIFFSLKYFNNGSQKVTYFGEASKYHEY